MSNIVARFHLRNIKTNGLKWRGFALGLCLLFAFTGCKKDQQVQFTTFNGHPAIEYKVSIEAQQQGAPSIYSPVSSITLPQ